MFGLIELTSALFLVYPVHQFSPLCSFQISLLRVIPTLKGNLEEARAHVLTKADMRIDTMF